MSGPAGAAGAAGADGAAGVCAAGGVCAVVVNEAAKAQQVSAAARTTITSGRLAATGRHDSPSSVEAHTVPLRAPTYIPASAWSSAHIASRMTPTQKPSGSPVPLGAQVSPASRERQTRVGPSFVDAVRKILEVRGRVVVMGMGKSGHVGRKIAATLATCHAFPGRLLIFFQPHGYGPLRTMRGELVAAFAEGMAGEDVLILCDPVYYGGTVERTVTSADIIADEANKVPAAVA